MRVGNVFGSIYQVGIQDFAGGRAFLRTIVADVAESHVSQANHLWLGDRLGALEASGFSMLKYVFSHILETLFLSFLTFS